MTIRDIVSDATRLSHRRLDLALSWLDIGKPRYYAGFLRGQAEALLPLEAALEARNVGALLRDWRHRARTPAMEHDLAAMDVGIDPLPQPVLKSAAEMFGAIYVLEATRMGARVMLARLAQHPESCSLGATAYLRHGFGKRLWPTFLAALETNPMSRGNPLEVVQGAELAYGMFESALIPVVSVAAE